MSPHEIVEALGTYGGAFIVGTLSSIMPFVSIDLFLIGLTVATGTSVAVAIPAVILAAAGQLAGKLPIYAASRASRTCAAPIASASSVCEHASRAGRGPHTTYSRSARSSGYHRSPSWRPPLVSSRSGCDRSAPSCL